MHRWLIAWRWLRSLSILWVSVVGVALGVASILVVDSIFNGVIQELCKVWRGSASDITVMTFIPPGRGGDTPIPADAVVRTVLGVDGVVGAAPRFVRPCLLPHGMRLPEVIAIGEVSRQSMIGVVGIEPEAEAGVSSLRDFLSAASSSRRVADLARPFDAPDLAPAPGTIPLIVGERFAEELRLERGAVFELMTIADVDPEGGDAQSIVPRSARFRVVGTFATTSIIEDLTRAYAPRQEMVRFAETLSGSTEVAVRAAPGQDLDSLAERIDAAIAPYRLHAAFERPVQTWAAKAADVLNAIDNQRQVLDLCLFCIVVVAGFNLLVSLHLLVTEKLKDVGTLVALGDSAVGVASIFSALGVLVTTVGAAIGLLGGWLLATNINAAHDLVARLTGRTLWDAEVYFFPEIPIAMQPQLVLLSVAGTFAVTLLFSFLGSLRVARLDPVETLRHEA
jgi:lipoprotein-releasing system permease protein